MGSLAFDLPFGYLGWSVRYNWIVVPVSLLTIVSISVSGSKTRTETNDWLIDDSDMSTVNTRSVLTDSVINSCK